MSDQRPPLFATWNSWYATLLGVLAFLIFAFALFTRCYA